MADLLNPDTSHERSTLRTLLLSAATLIAIAAIAFAVFYRHENHAPVIVNSTRTLTLPLHTTYVQTGKTAGGPAGGEDATYVAPAAGTDHPRRHRSGRLRPAALYRPAANL